MRGKAEESVSLHGRRRDFRIEGNTFVQIDISILYRMVGRSRNQIKALGLQRGQANNCASNEQNFLIKWHKPKKGISSESENSALVRKELVNAF